ncbi:MAG TPA: type II toxin-antitoxin system VapC family toxin [Catalimonadaceae bacterium]|nr:type II toxin-antitoxin system VapC family toxin [Catalimonadaceae bacterium]
MAYLLDTSICVFFLRGKLNLADKIREVGLENIYISEVTILELYFGAENSNNPTKSYQAVEKFLSGLKIVPLFGVMKRYAKEKVQLRRKGKPMHDEFDLLIGVTAAENKLTLVTDNVRDFQNIDNLKVENWIRKD